MYIVKKKISGRDYYYLRESKREKGKVKAITLAYLGKDRKEAEKKAKEIIAKAESKLMTTEKAKEEEKKEKVEDKGKIKKVKEEKTEKQEKEREIKIRSKIDEITSIASKRGFFFPTAEIYGGKAGFFTYGHLGKKLKSKFEQLWRKFFLEENFFEIQSNNILPEEVFKASGHLENFNDPMTECKNCKFRFRADQFLEDKGIENAEIMSVEEMSKIIKEKNLKCPRCGSALSEVKQFNMMFSVNIGFNEEKGYLSPETAQAAYLAFKQEFLATRGKLPLGIAIIDKAYRNEISPRQMFFRLREFTQAELQIFFNSEKINEHPDWNDVKKKKLRLKLAGKEEIEEITCEQANIKLKLPKFYVFYAYKIQDFYLNVLKVPQEKFRFRELGEKERAFYNKIHFDIEIELDTLNGFKEVAGLHYRTEHDLAGHQKVSGKNLEIFYDNKKILPHVLELSFGVDRNVWSLLDIFYSIGKEGSMFAFPSQLAPYEIAVLPLVNKIGMDKLAEEVYQILRKEFDCFYDDSGSIGRRYARQDEIGTPWAITIDGESLKKKDVTIRNRNNQKQIRVKISDLKEVLKKLMNNETEFENFKIWKS